MNGVKPEEMREQVMCYPNGSMHIAHPWDLDCFIDAVLRQLQSEAFYLHIYDIPRDELTLSIFTQPPVLLLLQDQQKEVIEIEIAPRQIKRMNLDPVYSQIQIPLDLGDVLNSPRMVFPFHIQTCETGARHPINALMFWMETIGEAYEAAGWAFSTATYEDTRSFTIHDQGWEIFR